MKHLLFLIIYIIYLYGILYNENLVSLIGFFAYILVIPAIVIYFYLSLDLLKGNLLTKVYICTLYVVAFLSIIFFMYVNYTYEETSMEQLAEIGISHQFVNLATTPVFLFSILPIHYLSVTRFDKLSSLLSRKN